MRVYFALICISFNSCYKLIFYYFKTAKDYVYNEEDCESIEAIGDSVMRVVGGVDYSEIESSTKFNWVVDLVTQYSDCNILLFSTWYGFERV